MKIWTATEKVMEVTQVTVDSDPIRAAGQKGIGKSPIREAIERDRVTHRKSVEKRADLAEAYLG